MDQATVPAMASGDVAPAPEFVQQRIREIWLTTLEVPDIQPTESFFDLGGDSMMMMIVLARVNEEFHIELREEVLFESPTLPQFCARVIAAAGVDPGDLNFTSGAI